MLCHSFYRHCVHKHFIDDAMTIRVFCVTALVDSSSFDVSFAFALSFGCHRVQLMAAAKNGRADDVVELISQGADIEFIRDKVRDMRCVVEWYFSDGNSPMATIGAVLLCSFVVAGSGRLFSTRI